MVLADAGVALDSHGGVAGRADGCRRVGAAGQNRFASFYYILPGRQARLKLAELVAVGDDIGALEVCGAIDDDVGGKRFVGTSRVGRVVLYRAGRASHYLAADT